MSHLSNTVSLVLVLLLCLTSLRARTVGVGSSSLCANGQTGCHVLPLSDLFDRVIQHSQRMHSISSDLHSEFEKYFLPSRNHIGRVHRNCHTSSILTPNGKENAQRLAREELTEVILKLLVAWKDPLWHLHQNMAHQEDFNSFSSNKALEMGDMVHELHKGVEKVAEKMQRLGIISNSVNSMASPEDLSPFQGHSGEPRLEIHHNLLYCFRRDTNKVQNYLKILKCRTFPEHGC